MNRVFRLHHGACVVMTLAVSQMMPVWTNERLDESISSRGSYYVDGEIHVGVYGEPEGKPLTTGHWDFKPSWSKTGDMLVFFRRLKDDPDVSKWKTAIHIIKADGSGLHQLTDGTHTDFNQTWTRNGTNVRRVPKRALVDQPVSKPHKNRAFSTDRTRTASIGQRANVWSTPSSLKKPSAAEATLFVKTLKGGYSAGAQAITRPTFL